MGGAVTVTEKERPQASQKKITLHSDTEVKLDKNDNSDNYSENPNC